MGRKILTQQTFPLNSFSSLIVVPDGIRTSVQPLTERVGKSQQVNDSCLAYLSRVVRKPAFCICENKDADQLCGNREAYQCLCFRYIDSTIPLLPIYEILSLQPSSVAVQPGLCGTWSETPKTSFLSTRLI